MKNNRGFLVLSVFLLSSCGRQQVPTPTTAAAGGWEVGSGGGKCKSKWIDAVKEAHAILEEGNLPQISGSRFLSLSDRTSIVPKNHVYLDAGSTQEVDAVNFPKAKPPRIEIGCEHLIAKNDSERIELVIHEFASLLGIDDSKKQVTGHLDVARICSRTPAIRAEIERASEKSCNVIRSKDLELISEMDISKKRISEIRAGDLAGLSKLKRLDVRGNLIQVLKTDVFAGVGLDAISGLSGPVEEPHDLGRESFPDGWLPLLTFPSVSDYWGNPVVKLERRFLGANSRVRFLSLCPDQFHGIIGAGGKVEGDGFLSELENGAFEGLAPGASVRLCLNLTGLSKPLSSEALGPVAKSSRLALVGFGLDKLPEHFFANAAFESLDLSQVGELTPVQLDEIALNERIEIVRFHLPNTSKKIRFDPQPSLHRAQEKLTAHIPHFTCEAAIEGPREPHYINHFASALTETGFVQPYPEYVEGGRMVCYRFERLYP